MKSFLDHLIEAECRTPVEKEYYKAHRHLHLCRGQKGKSASSKSGGTSTAASPSGEGGTGGGTGGGAGGGAGGDGGGT